MIYDLCIVGGGINGAGIARDAAGRGLKVLLLEKGDLASATSSNSSKMIHGGLRYLEFLEFSLVRKSLAERETLAAQASEAILTGGAPTDHAPVGASVFDLDAPHTLTRWENGEAKVAESNAVEF